MTAVPPCEEAITPTFPTLPWLHIVIYLGKHVALRAVHVAEHGDKIPWLIMQDEAPWNEMVEAQRPIAITVLAGKLLA